MSSSHPFNKSQRSLKSSKLFLRVQIYLGRILLFFLLAAVAIPSAITVVSAAPLYVPTLLATKTDTLINDGPGGVTPDDDGDGKADPGETIEYTVTITNSGTDATGVVYTDTIDSNTTLVPGSVAASPVAVNDILPVTVTGNVGISTTLMATPFSVITNDFQGLNISPGLTISTYDTLSAQGGQVTMVTSGAGIGRFSYDPPTGYEGTDTFSYTLSDNTNAGSAAANRTATVTINISGMIWFVNNNATACIANGCGRLSNPYSTLAAFNSANDGTDIGLNHHPAANDNIFIYESASAYTGGVTLLSGQKLIGQDSTQSLSAITGLSPVQGSLTLPAMNTGAPATVIQNGAGNGVTLNSGNTLNGFTASNSSGSAISGSGFGTLTVADVIVNTSGQALSLTNGTLSATFPSVTSSGGTNNIALAKGAGVLAGTLTINGGALSGASNNSFDLNGGGATISDAGTIASGSARSVNVTGLTGGSVTFTGAIADNDTGINLTTNTGATITFSGGLSLSTGANTAFNATGGGTVNVCDENPCNPAATGALVNTLTTTTGTALNVANTTIGANRLEFRSISSNGAPSGIVLNNTGSGGLTVTGNTSGNCGGNVTNSGATITAPVTGDCSGGTILNSTGTGILLTSASNISLTRMRIASSADDGIGGTTVSGFTLTSSLLENNGNAVGDRGIDITNLTGSGGIATSTIRSSKEHNIIIANTSGNLTAFNVTNSQIATNDLTPLTGTGDDGIQILNNGTGSMAISVTQSAFTDNKGDHFQAATTGSAANTGSITAVFSNNTLKTTAANDPQVVGGGITINPGGGADITFTISNNNIQQAFDDAININHDPSSTAASHLEGTISGNTIGTAADPDSGSESSNTITVAGKGAGTNTIAVTNNTIRQWSNTYGILVVISEGSASMNTTVTGNNVKNPGTFALNGIRLESGATSGPPADNGTLCVTFTGNDAAGSGFGGGQDIRVNQRFLTTIRLPGYDHITNGNNNNAAVNAFVTANNTLTTVNSTQNVAGGGGGFVGGATCATPIAMINNNQFLAYADIERGHNNNNVRGLSTLANTANAFTTAFNIGNLFKHTAWVKPQGTTVKTSTTVNDATAVSAAMNPADRFNTPLGDPGMVKLASWVVPQAETVEATTALLANNPGGDITQKFVPPPVPAQLGPLDPDPIVIGTLPAGKRVTIKFRVTVNNPISPGAGRILNQGTVSGSNFSNLTTSDPAPNGDAACAGTSPQTCTPIDRPDTTVTSITRQSANPTKNATVTWQIVFANPVDGLTASNFSLVNSGLGGSPAISSVTETSGPPATTWNITASTGSGSGTLELGMANDTGLSHDVTNLPYTEPANGAVYTIDRTPPTVTNVTAGTTGCLGSSPVFCNVPDTVSVQVTFSEVVNVTGTPQLALNSGGTASYASGSGTDTLTFTYNVAAGENAGDLDYTSTGALTLNGGTIQDAVTNDATLTLPTPGASGSLGFNTAIVVDTTAPTVTSFTRNTPTSQLTNADTLVFEVTFSEAIMGFGTADFIVHDNTPLATTTATATSVSSGPFRVSIGGGNLATFDGVVGLDFSPGMVITDQAGNPLANVEPATDETYTLDNTGPTVTLNQTSGQADPTNTSPISFTVTFGEAVSGFNASSDVILSGTAGATTAIISGGPTIYNVAVSGMTSGGTVIASINGGVATDAAGNGNTASTSTDNTVTYVPPTDLSITKTDGVATAVPGGNVVYTITASNAGPNNDPSATVVDTFPASLTVTWTCVGAGGGTCTASGSGNINNTVNLPAGGSVTYTASANVSAAATGTLVNTAIISSSLSDINPANNSATDTDTLVPQANLAITKTDGVVTAVAGGSVIYTITASNAGPSNVSNATVADTFPASLTVNWTCAGAGGATCTAAGSGNINDTVNLPAGGSVTYTASASISAAASGSLSNTATVSSAVTDPNPANNSATDTDTLSGQADLAITKTDGSAIAVAGNSIAYTITASNSGPSNAPGSTVADTFPASLTGVTWTCVGAGGATCTATGSGNINATVNLPAGGSVTYTANATLSLAATGTLFNTATVTAGVIDPNSANNSATDSDTVVPPVAVTINQKTSAPAQIDPTSASPINFTVVFAAAVTGFDAPADVTLGGTAGPTTINITGSGTTYNVAVSGMTGDGTVTATIPAGVATGSQGQPNAASTSTDNSVFYDATAPDTVIDAPTPTNPTNSTNANFTFHGDDGSGTGVANVQCKLDGGAFTACTTLTSQSYGGLSDGPHTFQVQAIDAVGNTDPTPASFTWVIDTTPPPAPVVITPANGGNTNNPQPLVSGTAEVSSTVTVFLDGVAAGTTTADAVGNWTFTPPSPLSDGSHTVRARSTDAVGNTSTDSNTNTFTVDTVAPTVTLTSAAPNPTSTSPIPVTVTFSESVTGFTAADISPGNATVSNFAGSGSGYTFDLIPNGPGLVTANIAAAVAQDAAANPNSAAAQFSRTFVGPEIALLGNNTVITDGDSSPSLTDETDFGSVALGGAITRTFTISNSGVANLNLSGSPLVALSGPAAGNFSVVTNPVTPVISNTSTTFRVRFDPTVAGTRAATVTIANNDSNENPYTFAISGTGISNGTALYLPLVLKDVVPAPDLVIVPGSLVATSGSVTLQIKNVGNAPVADAFWVDVYFNPNQTPSLNKRWQDIAPAGAVWGVSGAGLSQLTPGGTLTLTNGDAFYFPQFSSTPPRPVGASVFALPDSVNFSSSYGAVQESNEANNLFGPVISTASAGSPGAQPAQGTAGPSPEGLPPRE